MRRPTARRRYGRSSAVLGCLAALVLVAGCGGGSAGSGSAGSMSAGSGSAGSGGAGQLRATVGSAVVGYPGGWSVLPAADVPQGWDWAAQATAGAGATAQLAVDGDYSHAPSADLAVANLLAAAQVGALPHFAVRSRSATDVPGAADGVQVSFEYQTGGHRYDGLWVVARSEDSRVIAVQLTGIAPLPAGLVHDVRGAIRVSPR